MLGWVLGAILSLCDGLIWSELGTAYPEAGGSYAYLRKLYGEDGLGKPLSFLYAWQLLFSAPLSIASGCLGFSQYMAYFFPRSGDRILAFDEEEAELVAPRLRVQLAHELQPVVVLRNDHFYPPHSSQSPWKSKTASRLRSLPGRFWLSRPYPSSFGDWPVPRNVNGSSSAAGDRRGPSQCPTGSPRSFRSRL